MGNLHNRDPDKETGGKSWRKGRKGLVRLPLFRTVTAKIQNKETHE